MAHILNLRAPGVSTPAASAEAGYIATVASLQFDQVNIVVPDVAGAARFLRTLGAEVLRSPYDAFWGARYAVVRGPGPIVAGIMSPVDLESRSDPPAVSDFA